jgi:phage tail-like protein
MGERVMELTGVTTIGRQAADIVLEHPIVSRRHAQLELTDEGCTLTDAGSSNGTKVNGQALTANEPLLLNHGDTIEIGPFTLVYEQIVAEEEEPAPPPEPPAAESPGEPEPEPEPEPAVEAKPKPVAEKPKEKPEAAEKKKPAKGKATAPLPPTPPAPPPAAPSTNGYAEAYSPPPGLSLTASRYLQYLPDIYHTDFMARFLALFESIYGPIEWTVDNFDLYLHPQTAPAEFLPWLANWFDLVFDNSWGEEQRRTMLTEARRIFDRRGTKWALSRVLEIYTGYEPTIDDTSEGLEPFMFAVTLPGAETAVSRPLIEQLINHHKPAYTSYTLHFKSAK